jgi:hypothetical protein
MQDDIHAIRQRVVLPGEWNEVPIKWSAAAGFADDFNATAGVQLSDRHRENRHHLRVAPAKLKRNQTPDYIFSASDTKQLAISPRKWDTWSFYASGGACEGMLIFGNV